MFSTIPAAAPKQLASSPLQKVVCQVKFPIEAALASGEDAPAAQIHELLEEEYPRLTKELRAEIRVSSEGPMAAQAHVWKFSDLEGHWSVVLASNHVTLEGSGSAYTDWNEFGARFQRIVEAANQILTIRIFERVGLRYINEIGVDTIEDLRQTVRPAFLGPFADTDTSELHQWLGQLHMREDLGSAVLRYGLPQPGDALVYRIDTDCYNDQPTPFTVARQDFRSRRR